MNESEFAFLTFRTGPRSDRAGKNAKGEHVRTFSSLYGRNELRILDRRLIGADVAAETAKPSEIETTCRC